MCICVYYTVSAYKHTHVFNKLHIKIKYKTMMPLAEIRIVFVIVHRSEIFKRNK